MAPSVKPFSIDSLKKTINDTDRGIQFGLLGNSMKQNIEGLEAFLQSIDTTIINDSQVQRQDAGDAKLSQRESNPIQILKSYPTCTKT